MAGVPWHRDRDLDRGTDLPGGDLSPDGKVGKDLITGGDITSVRDGSGGALELAVARRKGPAQIVLGRGAGDDPFDEPSRGHLVLHLVEEREEGFEREAGDGMARLEPSDESLQDPPCRLWLAADGVLDRHGAGPQGLVNVEVRVLESTDEHLEGRRAVTEGHQHVRAPD